MAHRTHSTDASSRSGVLGRIVVAGLVFAASALLGAIAGAADR